LEFKLSQVITLTTDFGTKDGYVAQMKGVILSINPNARIVDATHDIEPFCSKEAALVVNGFFGYYPEKTVHVVVVDPGVGSARRCIVVSHKGHLFVGPDNGVFTPFYMDGSTFHVREVTNPAYFKPLPHPTFHGRDIFAPVAAYLSKGSRFQDIGPIVDDPTILPFPEVVSTDYGLKGKVIYVDRFGNLWVNIRSEMLIKPIEKIDMGSLSIKKLCKTYQNVPDYDPVALINSSGFMEIAINKASAFNRFGIGEGAKVKVIWRSDNVEHHEMT
jgi:hypothetical protein